jgi:hypothetical protein
MKEYHMNKKITPYIVIILTAAGTGIAFGRTFFELTVHNRNGEKTSMLSGIRFPHMKRNHPRNQFEEEYEAGKAWCREQNMQDWYIKSADGLKLHAYYLPADNPKRYVLLSHGYKGNCFSEFGHIAGFLHDRGCNLLFIDQRACGMSEGEYITFGAKEKKDIQRWCCLIDKRNENKLPIYLYGKSMGAAAVLMATGEELPDDVKGVISDCGFQSMKRQFRDMASKWFHLPRIELLLFRLSVWCRFSAGFSINEADTSKALATNKRPILFFHGDDDTYVYPKNSLDNYNNCTAPKELVMVHGARHMCSEYVDKELYEKKLISFFHKYD